MIHLMLADLGWPAGEFLALFFPIPVVVFDFDVLCTALFSARLAGRGNLLLFRKGRFSRTITGLNMMMSRNPAFTMMMRFFTPIIFAAMPTHASRFAASVSCNLFPPADLPLSPGWISVRGRERLS